MDAPPFLQKLEVSDWLRFRAIYLRAMDDSPEAFTATLLREEQQPESLWRKRMEQGAVFVFSDGEKDVAFTMILGLAEGDVGLGLWVSPDLRGRGLGSALLDAVLLEASEAGVRRVLLNVADSHLVLRWKEETGSNKGANEQKILGIFA
eukprot:symbB.v1.2.035503.t1/scaffold4766.1/size35193/4